MFENYVSLIDRQMRAVLRCVSVVILFSVSATAVYAQTTGSLSGTVQDQTKALVPGAKITLVNTASKARRTTTADGQGVFQMQALQPSTYDLTITAPGFESYKVTGIEINPGDSRVIPAVQLKLGEMNAEVTVTATVAGVSLDSPEKSSLITAEDIKRLSTVGRDATELIKNLPGFALATGGSLQNGQALNNQQTMGFTGSATANYSANGSTPQTGSTQVISDGASTVDPGDMGASISNINMDMVQEIKVQTSNFGADSAKGPVVINAVGKSGGASYHGSLYLFARNGSLNANDWLNNYEDVPRPDSSYYYPGGNVGGPVKIPGTNFNHSKKLTFFTGFEYYKQRKFDQTLLSFIPTPAMLGGDLTPQSIARALNVDVPTVTSQCAAFYSTSSSGSTATLNGLGGICYSPGLSETTYTQQYQKIAGGNVGGGVCDLTDAVGAGYSSAGCLPVDPRAAAFAKFWPKPNRTARAGNGLASDGYNYVKAVTSSHDGYQYRARVDENFTDNTKLYVTYNFETINDQQPIQDGYYAGSDIIPYPTSAFSNTKSHSLSINFTHVFGPTLTNEAVAAGTYYYQPNQLANRAMVQDAQTGFTGGRFYNNGALQLPGIVDYEEGVPDFAMNYFPSAGRFYRKVSYNGADNLTKQYKTHTIKVGVYGEMTANNQVPYNYTQGEYTFNHYNSGCTANDMNPAHYSQLHNNIANFLQGCGSFLQLSNSNPQSLRFPTVDFYATDEWKATRKLTLTYGMRFDHQGPWVDPHGQGLAVWNAPAQHVFFSGVTSDAHTFPGISWHATDSKVPLTGQKARFLFYSPRAGLAYDLKGDGKTVFRGGWGAYRFHDSYNDAAGPLSTSTGAQSYQTSANLGCTYDQVAGATIQFNGAAVKQNCITSSGSTSVSPFGIYALDPHDDQQPVTYNYNFTIDQALRYGMSLEIGYVGNQSAHGITASTLSNQNYIPLGGLFQPDPLTGAVTQPGNQQQVQQDYRPYPNYTFVNVASHITYGNYNGLQVSLNKQKGRFIFGANYTFSKALGIHSDYRTGQVGDPSTLRNNYGYLGFNRTHVLNFTYSYQVGNAYHGNRYVAGVLNQWEVSGITNIQSGPDVAVLTGNGNFSLSGGGSYTPTGSTTSVPVNISNTQILGTPDIQLQPVITCDPTKNLYTSKRYGKQYVNQACFSLPQLGKNGQFEMPNIPGPGYFNSDLTLQRSFKLHDQQNLQFRAAAFNFLNHPLPQFYGGTNYGLGLSFADPTGLNATTPQQAVAGAVANTTNFGYTPYKGGFRILEFSARYNF